MISSTGMGRSAPACEPPAWPPVFPVPADAGAVGAADPCREAGVAAARKPGGDDSSASAANGRAIHAIRPAPQTTAREAFPAMESCRAFMFLHSSAKRPIKPIRDGAERLGCPAMLHA